MRGLAAPGRCRAPGEPSPLPGGRRRRGVESWSLGVVPSYLEVLLGFLPPPGQLRRYARSSYQPQGEPAGPPGPEDKGGRSLLLAVLACRPPWVGGGENRTRALHPPPGLDRPHAIGRVLPPVRTRVAGPWPRDSRGGGGWDWVTEGWSPPRHAAATLSEVPEVWRTGVLSRVRFAT